MCDRSENFFLGSSRSASRRARKKWREGARRFARDRAPRPARDGGGAVHAVRALRAGGVLAAPRFIVRSRLDAPESLAAVDLSARWTSLSWRALWRSSSGESDVA
jgi:hypothetical protein